HGALQLRAQLSEGGGVLDQFQHVVHDQKAYGVVVVVTRWHKTARFVSRTSDFTPQSTGSAPKNRGYGLFSSSNAIGSLFTKTTTSVRRRSSPVSVRGRTDSDLLRCNRDQTAACIQQLPTA